MNQGTHRRLLGTFWASLWAPTAFAIRLDAAARYLSLLVAERFSGGATAIRVDRYAYDGWAGYLEISARVRADVIEMHRATIRRGDPDWIVSMRANALVNATEQTIKAWRNI